MIPTKLAKVALAAAVVAWIAPCTAKAEGKLSELEGEWSGSGTDRSTPFESMQKTSCQSKIRSDQHRMSNEIVCVLASGVRKTMHMQAALDGGQIKGELVQTQTRPREATQSRKGLVSGRRTGDAADIQIQFSGMTPTATVKFVAHNASSYSLRVSALGAQMMDVTFKRVGQPAQAKQSDQPTQAKQDDQLKTTEQAQQQ
jgi:hypothetical protein